MRVQRYDESFKTEAVNLALSSEQSYAATARDLGISYKTLTNWIYARLHQTSASVTSKARPVSVASVNKHDYQELLKQNKAMQKELDLRKKELEILKKAAAYFASLKS